MDYSITVGLLKQSMQLSNTKNKTSFVTSANVVLPIVRTAQSSSGFKLIYQVGLNSSRSATYIKKIIVNYVEQSLSALKNKENPMQNKQGQKKRSKNNSVSKSSK